MKEEILKVYCCRAEFSIFTLSQKITLHKEVRQVARTITESFLQ